eukprot:161271-Pyramimonas_sp.AAC.1
MQAWATCHGRLKQEVNTGDQRPTLSLSRVCPKLIQHIEMTLQALSGDTIANQPQTIRRTV